MRRGRKQKMSLNRLFSSDFGGIAEWREMWNNEVLPYLHSERLVAGPGVRIDRRPAGTLIRVVSSGGAGGTGRHAGITLAAVVTMPTSVGGVGAVKPVEIDSGGEIVLASGAEIPAVFPFLDGYN